MVGGGGAAEDRGRGAHVNVSELEMRVPSEHRVEVLTLPVAGRAEREIVDVQENVPEGGVAGVGALPEVRGRCVVRRPVQAEPMPAAVLVTGASAAPGMGGDRRDGGEPRHEPEGYSGDNYGGNNDISTHGPYQEPLR